MLATITQYAVPFLIVLSVVVFVHEFGHYWVARRNGVRIEVFSIGFGPELFGRNDRHGTRWKVSAVPLGGYVKMLGDADAASAMVDLAHARDPDSFPSKSVWQRMAIVVAGPMANFAFAIVALAILFAAVGRPFTPPEVGTVQQDSPAAVAGLLPGDRITAVDGQPIASFEELQSVVFASEGQPLQVSVDREGETLEVTVTPTVQGDTDRFGTRRQVWRIGVSRPGVEYRRSNPFSAPFEAAAETGRMIWGTLHALGEIVVGKRGTQELGGPLRIAQMSGQIAQDGFVPALWFTAVLSINLGLINLFPIPMLDGGHLAMYGIEAARGRPLNERSQEIAFRFGLAMVLSLMVFATWNDVVQFGWVERLLNLIS
jgi:regulator of sigma E protease